MNKEKKLRLALISVVSLLFILLGIFIALWNTKISWVVCDKYDNYEDCYRVIVKFGDYFLNGEECYEEYEEINYE